MWGAIINIYWGEKRKEEKEKRKTQPAKNPGRCVSRFSDGLLQDGSQLCYSFNGDQSFDINILNTTKSIH